MGLSEILTLTGIVTLLIASTTVVFAAFRTNTAKVWKEEAEAQKARADTVLGELEKVKTELTQLKDYTQTLVLLLSTIDPQKLEDLRLRRGL